MSLKHATILPNLHLNRLNPSVKPHYDNLEIPTSLHRWPVLPIGSPRRASVNSFGFGGTNAHVILESYEQASSQSLALRSHEMVQSMPFCFSAASQTSLKRLLGLYSVYLKNNKSIDPSDLLHTLASRRSQLAIKVAFCAENIDSTIEKLDALVEQTEDCGIVSSSNPERILGIFTGQGAQYAEMGKDLFLSSQAVRATFKKLEGYLAELPVADRPDWSLSNELLAAPPISRLTEATVAQPLCTAIQIVLVDLLRLANIKFSAVLGHSSGEIGAAYSAGYLNDREAICIAYYRGLHSRLAGNGHSEGLMLAVGTSPKDAQELCDFKEFKDRIVVAAVNSSASVTLSGDAEAIEEAEAIFKDEKKFARLLKVDKAYHSHHMRACSESYLASLKECEIRGTRRFDHGAIWYSSVHGAEISEQDDLSGPYWNDNLVNPVLFKQAIEAAVSVRGSFDIAIEVGPHPALQGPALQVLADTLGKPIPYVGILNRSTNALKAVATALGSIWSHVSEGSLNLESLQNICQPSASKPKLLTDLPSYPWDHERIFWHESSLSKSFRVRNTRPHELLGTQLPDGTEHEQRWRNFISIKEIPWLHGHQLQGQPVFPAAGYASMAFESALFIDPDKPKKTIEILDLIIKRPITFDDEATGIETLFTLTNIVKESGRSTTSAKFKCFSVPSKDTGMVLAAQGVLRVNSASHSEFPLPARAASRSDLVQVDTNRFYNSLRDLGYGYSESFKGLHTLERQLGFGTGLVRNPIRSHDLKQLLVHPGMLDSAFQSVFLAYSWPGDGRLWSLHVPTHISKIRVDVELAEEVLATPGDLQFDCVLHDSITSAIYGDIDLYSLKSSHAVIQIEGMNAVPVAAATPEDDRIVFADIAWYPALPNGSLVARANPSHGAVPIEASFNRLASMVSQITNRYPRIRILDLLSTGSRASELILKEIDRAFGEYTIALTPGADLDAVKETFSTHPQFERIQFEVLDLGSDLLGQGYEERSYDLVIDPLSLYSVGDLEIVLKNLRLLL